MSGLVARPRPQVQEQSLATQLLYTYMYMHLRVGSYFLLWKSFQELNPGQVTLGRSAPPADCWTEFKPVFTPYSPIIRAKYIVRVKYIVRAKHIVSAKHIVAVLYSTVHHRLFYWRRRSYCSSGTAL